jgi:carbonic anhydrase
MNTEIKYTIIIIFTLVIGFVIARYIYTMPPKIDSNKKGASVLVLGCIDPRFANALGWYLTHSEELHMDYDMFKLAGASLGVLQEKYTNWPQTFKDHIQLAIDLHDIKEIWVFDHMDCGMYKATYNIENDNDIKPHIDNLTKLKKLIEDEFKLKYKGFIMNVDGSIKNVV